MTFIWIIMALLAITGLLLLLGKYTFWLPSGAKQAPRILMYHSVDANKPQDGLNIHPNHFEQQLNLLIKQGYSFLTALELAEKVNQGECDFNKTALITFDDGFENNYTQAFPILEKLGVKATIYLTYKSPDIKMKLLNQEQIKTMVDSGLIEFGAHTISHVNLTTISDEEALEEIVQSKEQTENLTSKPCVSFAYPYGRFNEAHVEMIKNAGFTSSVTTKKRLKVPNVDMLFSLPRLTADGSMNKIQWRIVLSKGRYKL